MQSLQVIVSNTKALERSIEMLSCNNSSERNASVTFLLELSETETLLENIGSVAGCILMLITMKYNEFDDSFAAEKAGKILKNLEKVPKNIKSMAEYGFLEPLLDHLVAGIPYNLPIISYQIAFLLFPSWTEAPSEHTHAFPLHKNLVK